MSNFIWKAKFKIEPRLQKSEVIDGYAFKVIESGETVIEREYITSSYDEMHPKKCIIMNMQNKRFLDWILKQFEKLCLSA